MKISCVIPVFNCARTLRRAVDSCLRHAGEIIIVDDCSSDGSHQLALEIARASSCPIQIMRNESNSGPAFSRNRGAFAAKGELLCFLDADDCYLDGFFERTGGLLSGNPNIAAIKTSVRVQDANGDRKLALDDPRLVNIAASYPCNMAVRREIFLLLGGFPVDPRFRGPLGGEDDCFFNALSALFRCHYVAEELVAYNSKPGDHLEIFLSRTSVENGLVIFRDAGPQVRTVIEARQEFLERARKSAASVNRCRRDGV